MPKIRAFPPSYQDWVSASKLWKMAKTTRDNNVIESPEAASHIFSKRAHVQIKIYCPWVLSIYSSFVFESYTNTFKMQTSSQIFSLCETLELRLFITDYKKHSFDFKYLIGNVHKNLNCRRKPHGLL